MSDKLEVIITGKNGVSRIFKEVTSDATTMGTSVETASKKGAASFSAWTSGAQKAGAAFATLALVSTKISGEAEASQARLTGAFENAGLAIDDYAESIERLQDKGLKLAFDDEDVADSIAKLVGVTKDAGQAFEDLALAQNIARAENISLAQATGIIEAAETGRFRALASIGIKLDETATKEEYLAAAREKYAGASERFANTGAADFERWQNTAENALESVGSKLSAVQGPLLALSAGTTVLSTVGGLLAETGAGAVLASAALGPAGLAVAALAAGAGILYLASRTNEYVDAADQAAISTGNLENFFASLAATLDPKRAEIVNGIYEQLISTITDAAARESDLYRIRELRSASPQGVDLSVPEIVANTTAYFGLTEAQLQYLDSNKDTLISIEELDAAIVAYTGNLDRLNADQIKTVTTDIENLLSRPNVNFVEAASAIQGWVDQLNSGAISGEEFVAKIEDAATNFKPYILANRDAAAATVELADAQAKVNITSVPLIDNLVKISDVQTASAVAAGKQYVAALNLVDAYGQTVEVLDTEFTPASNRMSASMDVQIQRAKEITAAIADYGDALGNIPNLEARSAQGFAARAGQAGAALGDAFRVAVGNTNAIGSQSSQVADWAKELIGVSGQYAKIDDLLAKGVITQDQYNAAQAAGTKIFDANARIQDDILEIQSKQAPLLADLTEEQARYMDHLADLPASQQLVRLGFMDSAESAKALAAAELAAAAANGELGAAGEETATKMIAAAAEADPVLRAMLENMGLISVGADGTITVNFDSVEDANASLDDVVGILRELRDVIAEAFGIVIDSNAADQRDALQGVIDRLNELNGKQVVYTVSASGNGVSVGNPNGPGIEPIANGGVIPAANGYAGDILVGEFGPELLKRRGGGGLVLPTGATKSRMAISGPSGVTVNINIGGSVNGIDDLTEQVTRQLVPAIKLAFENHYQGHGVR